MVVYPDRTVRVFDAAHPPTEPISVDTLKALGRIDRTDEDEIYAGFISAARQKFERDTDISVVDQAFDLLYAATGDGYAIPLAPVQTVVSVVVVANGVATPAPDGAWSVTTDAAGISTLTPGAGWPTGTGVAIRVQVGYADPADLDPLIVQAVGLLAVHYATAGRDLVSDIQLYPVPETYTAMVEPLRRITVI